MKNSIFNQVADLNLPFGEYAVVGSGVMSAHGIREHKDIDLLVTPRLYEELKAKGWKEKAIRPDFVVVENDIFEASPNMITLPMYQPDVPKLIREADIINGISFVKLEEVINFKRAMGREKDLKDIDLINNYLTAEIEVLRPL